MNQHNPAAGPRGAGAQRSPAQTEETRCAYGPLLESMAELVERMRMLTGIAIAYGTEKRFFEARAGSVQEVEMEGGVPAPRVRPAREDTLYDLASLTKLFTLISVMQLEECGQLSLGDLVGAMEPRFAGLSGVSVGQVLRYEATLETPRRIDEQPDREAALRQVFAMCVRPSEPQRPYSDMNALVLKYVVERASGMPFLQYVQKHILTPAGMAETFSLIPPERLADCACYNYEHRILGERYSMRTDAPPGVPHDAKAQKLCRGGLDLCGHAGLFSTMRDMVRLCQALLSGRLIPVSTLLKLSAGRRGSPDDGFRQYLGTLCFVKGPQQRFSEVPEWMSDRAIAQSGFTGNHVAVDPELGVFDIFLGNRCHNRVSVIQPPEGVPIARYGLSESGAGRVPWPDGRLVQSSYLYVHQKDEKLHRPIRDHMRELGWL